jgi:hypothetical protein
MNQYHRATIKNGQFFSDKKVFNDRIKDLPDGNYLMLLIKQFNRTVREWQNHYFAILGEWSNDMGWSKSDLHDYVKEHLFNELFGEEISTADLTEEQWNIVFLNLENFLILQFENS